MRHFRCFRHNFAGLTICLTTAAILTGPQVLRAQVAGPSRVARESEYRISSAEEERLTPPVQRLREALNLPFNEEDAGARKEELSKRIDHLHYVLDLRQALTLHEWRDEDANEMVSKIDQEMRREVEKKLVDILRRALQSGQAGRQMAAADFLEVIGASIRSTVGGEAGGRPTMTAALAPDLVEVLKGKNADVNAAAARALGRIFPDPKIAIPSLKRVLRSGQVSEQQAAAGALTELIRVADKTFKDARKPDSSGLAVSRREVIDIDRGAVQAASQGFGNRDPDVRLRCVEALHQAGIGMGELVPLARPAEEEPKEEEGGDLLPLAKALADQGDSLGRALRDAKPQIRLTAAHALEEMGNARLRLLRAPARAKLEKPAGESLPQDALLRGLRAALPALAQSLRDPQREVRLAAVEVMETLGPETAAATGPLTRALGDSNPFVRWSAARALANIDPELDRPAAETAVPALAQVLFDPDVDTREAAAATLEKYGSAAKVAVPNMARAMGEGDAGPRIAIIRALIVVITANPPDAQAAIPALIKVLDHPDDRVRRIAAHALGRFGPLGRDAEPALRRALDDPEDIVRKAAAESLLNLNVKE